MLHLPWLHHQNTGDLILGRLWRFPISPPVRVSALARTAHLYVIGMSGKGKPKLLERVSFCNRTTITASTFPWAQLHEGGGYRVGWDHCFGGAVERK